MSVLALALLLVVQELQLPSPPRGFSATEADMVVDAAGVLSSDAVARMNRAIFGLKTRFGGEIVVVTMSDLAGREAADVALRIGREWQVGEAGDAGVRSRNAGVVVLLVPVGGPRDGRGQIAIQTGRGAEGFIPDGIAGEIRRSATPYFQRQDYSGGLEAVTAGLVARYEQEFGPDSLRRRRMPSGAADIPPQAVLGVFVVLLFLLWGMANASRNRGCRGCMYALIAANVQSSRHRHVGWGGGGFGGGSFGGGGGFGGFGGGGGFSGGGSSGSW